MYYSFSIHQLEPMSFPLLLNLVYWFYATQALLQTSNAWIIEQCPTSALWSFVLVTVIRSINNELFKMCFSFPPEMYWKDLLYRFIVHSEFIIWGWYELQHPGLTDAIRDTHLYKVVFWSVMWNVVVGLCLVVFIYLLTLSSLNKNYHYHS
jgi:hypothetical protein